MPRPTGRTRPGNRPTGLYLPGDQSGGPALSDVRQGVDAWLGRARPADEGAGPARSDDAVPLPPDSTALGPDADAEAVARKILLDQLTGQARSRAELASRLARKGVPDEVAERLLTRFEEVGLVDDAAFARAWVQSRQSGKGLARRALALELRRKGIDDEDARAALDEVDSDDELEAARALVRRKLRSVARLDRATATRRLAGMLARKGHPAGVAMRVVREELAAAYADVPDAPDLDPDLDHDVDGDSSDAGELGAFHG